MVLKFWKTIDSKVLEDFRNFTEQLNNQVFVNALGYLSVVFPLISFWG